MKHSSLAVVFGKILLGLALLAVCAFCVFGFLATFEAMARTAQFWRRVAHDLPREPEVYRNPREAEQLLARIPLHEDLHQLRADVIQLHSLLPRGLAGEGSLLPTHLR